MCRMVAATDLPVGKCYPSGGGRGSARTNLPVGKVEASTDETGRRLRSGDGEQQDRDDGTGVGRRWAARRGVRSDRGSRRPGGRAGDHPGPHPGGRARPVRAQGLRRDVHARDRGTPGHLQGSPVLPLPQQGGHPAGAPPADAPTRPTSSTTSPSRAPTTTHGRASWTSSSAWLSGTDASCRCTSATRRPSSSCTSTTCGIATERRATTWRHASWP